MTDDVSAAPTDVVDTATLDTTVDTAAAFDTATDAAASFAPGFDPNAYATTNNLIYMNGHDVSNNGINDPAFYNPVTGEIITLGADGVPSADDLKKSIYALDPSEQDAMSDALKSLTPAQINQILNQGNDQLDAKIKELLNRGNPTPNPNPNPGIDWNKIMQLIMALLCRPQTGGGSGGGSSGGGCGSGGGSGSGGGCGSGGGMGMGNGCSPFGQNGMNPFGMNGMNPFGQSPFGQQNQMSPYSVFYGNGRLGQQNNMMGNGMPKPIDINGDGRPDMFAVQAGNQTLLMADNNGNGQLDQGDSIIGIMPMQGQGNCMPCCNNMMPQLMNSTSPMALTNPGQISPMGWPGIYIVNLVNTGPLSATPQTAMI